MILKYEPSSEPRKVIIHLMEREFFIENLLVRINLIIKMILVDWPCVMEV